MIISYPLLYSNNVLRDKDLRNGINLLCDLWSNIRIADFCDMRKNVITINNHWYIFSIILTMKDGGTEKSVPIVLPKNMPNFSYGWHCFVAKFIPKTSD